MTNVSNRTTNELIELFEETEKMEITNELATVRGWIMDELETRNAEAFEKWIDNCEIEPSPRKFFH